jgi:hypothetical protein
MLSGQSPTAYMADTLHGDVMSNIQQNQSCESEKFTFIPVLLTSLRIITNYSPESPLPPVRIIPYAVTLLSSCAVEKII